MRQDSTTPTQRFIRELIGALILGAVILALASMAGFFSVSEAGAAPRKTPTAVVCETIVEGILRCPDGFATSQARPGQFDRPRTATPTRRPR